MLAIIASSASGFMVNASVFIDLECKDEWLVPYVP
jgi:hypothetical protein